MQTLEIPIVPDTAFGCSAVELRAWIKQHGAIRDSPVSGRIIVHRMECCDRYGRYAGWLAADDIAGTCYISGWFQGRRSGRA